MDVYTDYDEALSAKGEGQSLCGAYRGDQPVYFLVPADMSDEAVRDVAFEVRHGRPMSTYEKSLLSAAEALAAKKEPVPA